MNQSEAVDQKCVHDGAWNSLQGMVSYFQCHLKGVEWTKCRIMPSLLGLLKNNDRARSARSLFLTRPRIEGIIPLNAPFYWFRTSKVISCCKFCSLVLVTLVAVPLGLYSLHMLKCESIKLPFLNGWGIQFYFFSQYYYHFGSFQWMQLRVNMKKYSEKRWRRSCFRRWTRPHSVTVRSSRNWRSLLITL